MKNILDFKLFNKPTYNDIRITQNCNNMNLDKIKSIRNDMLSNKYDFKLDSNKISYELFEDIIYITEGHHRFIAAASISKKMVNNLLDNALIYKVSKKPYLSKTIPYDLIKKIK
jgi:hypothetical protein